MHRRVLSSAGLLAAALCYSAWSHAATLYPGTSFQAPNTPGAVVMAQLRPGSGLQDIVEIGQTGYINILLNNGDGTFAAPLANYVSDGMPRAVAVADVNGDGIPDIIVCNVSGLVVNTTASGNDVTVLLGNGDGSFKGLVASQVGTGLTGAPSYAVGNTPLSLAVADVNGDGHPDIVVANSLDNDVSVLINNGDGTFQAQQVYSTGVYPDCVAIADVDNDGHLDILVDNAAENSFVVLFGIGDGTFRAPNNPLSLGAVQVTSTPQLQTFAAGRMSPGGPVNVVISVLGGSAGSISMLLNDGQGNFHIGKTYAAGLNPLTLQLADLHDKSGAGNGFLDLIAVSSQDSAINVFFGNGDGTLGVRTTYAVVGVSTSPAQQAVAAADVDGDGYADLVVANPDNETMQVLYNAGPSSAFPPGTFHPRAAVVSPTLATYAAGQNPSAVASGVLTASGNNDVVVANAADNDIGVLLGNGDGTLQKMVTYPAGKSPQGLVLVALRGSGHPLDAVTANFGDGTVSVLLGNGNGSFQPQQAYTAVPATPGATLLGVSVADINGDGIPDLIVTNGVSNTFGVLLGKGDGTFQAVVTFSNGTPLDSLAVGDVTADGLPDVVTVGGVINIFENTTPQCSGTTPLNCENPANVSFTPVQQYGISGVQIAIGDVNNDGTADLLVADYSRGNVDVMLGVSASPGTFLSPITYGSAAGVSSLQLVGLKGSTDINDDGTVDIVTTNALNNSVGVLFGNGAGAFLTNLYPVEFNPRSAAVANLANRFYDAGKTQPISDLIVANHGSNTLTVLLQVAGAVAGDTAPVAANQSLTVPDGKFPGSGSLVATDSDPTATLTFGIVEQAGNGSVSLFSASGFYEYQANSEFAGTDSFAYQVSDGVKLSNKGTVTITVQSNSAVTSSSGGGAFGPLACLLLLPLMIRRRIIFR